MLRLRLVSLGLLAAALLAACGGEPAYEPTAADQLEADVEAYRTAALARLLEADQELQALEAEAEQFADSALQRTYGQQLAPLRQQRRQIEERLQALEADSAAAFAEARRDLDRAIHALDRGVDRTQLALAGGTVSYRAVARREVEELDQEIERLRDAVATADHPLLAEVEREREALGQELNRLEQATAEAFAAARHGFETAFERTGEALGTARSAWADSTDYGAPPR